MKFSVIGELPASMTLVSEILRSEKHSLGPCSVTGLLASEFARAGVPFHMEDSAEAAILAGGVDVVVLAVRDTEDVLRLTRSATQADRHVAVILPENLSTAFSFELHLLFDECQHSVVPLNGRIRLTNIPLDAVVQSLNDRELLQMSQEAVIPAAAVDQLRNIQATMVDVLSSTGIRFTQVTAVEATAPNGQLISRSLTFAASASADQVVPPATIQLRVQPQTTSGSWEAGPLRVMSSEGSVSEIAVGEPQMLQRIERLCENRSLCAKWLEEFSTTMELCDSIDKSLRRRRTVDVYFDSGSERGVFKGMMTAIGCGVLIWTLLGMVIFLITAKLASLPPTVLEIIRVLWIAPLILFLLAQFLLPLARERKS